MTTKNTGCRLRTMNSPLGDCTNGGVSAGETWIVVVGRIIDGIVEEVPEQLRTHGSYGTSPLFAVSRIGGLDSLVPVSPFEDYFVPSTLDDKVGPMHGGNIAIADPSSDWRFLKWLTSDMPKFGIWLRILDRFETQAAYDALSD